MAGPPSICPVRRFPDRVGKGDVAVARHACSQRFMAHCHDIARLLFIAVVDCDKVKTTICSTFGTVVPLSEYSYSIVTVLTGFFFVVERSEVCASKGLLDFSGLRIEWRKSTIDTRLWGERFVNSSSMGFK